MDMLRLDHFSANCKDLQSLVRRLPGQFKLKKVYCLRLVIVALCISLLLLGLAFGQTDRGTITGTITDSAGAVIPGAVVEAKGAESAVPYKEESTETGKFTLLQLPAGEYELTALAPGFKQSVRKGIKLRAAQTLLIDITLEVGEISQTITVSAAAPLNLLEHPQQESEPLQTLTSTVDRIQIEKQGAETVMDALNYVPGAWTETRGRKEKQLFSVRGQKYPYPEYAVDGAVFREFYEVPYFLSAEDVQRIEVMRSSATLLSGVTGLVGVINIVPRVYEQRETRWLAEYGSLDSYRVHVSHGQKIGNLSYGLGMGGSHTDGPEGRHGAETMLNLFGNATWKPRSSLSVQATALYAHGKRELVQAEPPAAEQYRTALQRFDPVEELSANIRTLYQPTDWASTQFTVGYGNRHNTFVAETGSTSQSTSDFDHELNLNLIQALALSKSNVFRIGANYNHWVAPYGKRFYSGRRSDLETYSIAIVDEHSFGRLLLDGGLRYQRTYIDEYGAFNIDGTAQGFKKVESIVNQWEPGEISGSLGASYRLTNRLSLQGNFLTGVVEPRRGTLTDDLQEPATEHRTMVDMGLHLRRDRLGEFSLTGFLIKRNDAIVLSGETLTLNGRIMELYENRDQDSKGVEFEFRSRPLLENINLFFNATAMRSRARIEGSMSLDREIPQVIMGGGILGRRRAFDYNLFWKFVSGYESSRFADLPVPQPLGGFHSLNLTLGYSLGSSERIRVYLEVTNLTDNRYSTVVGYPDYGRRFQLGIRQAF
jgi:outer membrane receptor protein involved in Fe transport